MLYLIGLGLDKKDLSMKALEAIKACKKVYLEIYTSILPCKKEELRKIIKKKIIEADRDLVEKRTGELIKEAKRSNIALLIPGDPLSATTHINLLLEARKSKLKVQIIHAPSILTVVAETGLQLYKFGKITSIPKWQPSYEPESFYDLIKQNLSINAHTLLLLDSSLSINEALGYIRKISEKRIGTIKDRIFVVCSRIGTKHAKVDVGRINKLIKKEFKLPACIIIPASLHFTEAEMLELKKEEKNNYLKK